MNCARWASLAVLGSLVTGFVFPVAGAQGPPAPPSVSLAACIMIWVDVPPGAWVDFDCLGVCPLPIPGPIICIAVPVIGGTMCIPPC